MQDGPMAEFRMVRHPVHPARSEDRSFVSGFWKVQSARVGACLNLQMPTILWACNPRWEDKRDKIKCGRMAILENKSLPKLLARN